MVAGAATANSPPFLPHRWHFRFTCPSQQAGSGAIPSVRTCCDCNRWGIWGQRRVDLRNALTATTPSFGMHQNKRLCAERTVARNLAGRLSMAFHARLGTGAIRARLSVRCFAAAASGVDRPGRSRVRGTNHLAERARATTAIYRAAASRHAASLLRAALPCATLYILPRLSRYIARHMRPQVCFRLYRHCTSLLSTSLRDSRVLRFSFSFTICWTTALGGCTQTTWVNSALDEPRADCALVAP